MSKIRRVIFMLVAAVAFLLPAAQPAQAAAWFSPNGHYLWTVYGYFCRNGVEIVMLHKRSDTPQSIPEFAPLTFDFSAYPTTAQVSRTPQKATSVPIGPELATFSLLIDRHAHHPLHWTDDDTQQTGYAYIYGKENLTWSDLPVGTPVAVKMTQSYGDFFVAAVDDCRV